MIVVYCEWEGRLELSSLLREENNRPANRNSAATGLFPTCSLAPLQYMQRRRVREMAVLVMRLATDALCGLSSWGRLGRTAR